MGLWVSVAGASTAVVWATLPWLNVYWIWMLLAARGLDAAAFTVVRALERGDLDDARAKLAMIVGRDTATLDEAEIMRAVIETVSENTSDAIVAPIFYLVIGGPAAIALLWARHVHYARPPGSMLVSSTRQTSCSKLMPRACAAFGTSEWLVMPGAVFASSR